MLYKIFETQRTLMEPFADFALATAKLYSNPMSPLGNSSLGQRVSAGYDLIYRLGKDYEKPEFGITTVQIGDQDIAIHERIEISKPFCELRRFKRFSDDHDTLLKLKQHPVVLIVAPLSGHYATLLRGTVIREPRATFSIAPGQPPRPATRTAVPGLYLAGDWIATGLPATIESAVRSGHRAADAAIADADAARA